MSLLKTSSRGLLNARQPTAPRWVTKPRCFPYPRQTWVRTTFGKDFGYLHTPTTKANYAARSMQKWPSARNFVKVFGRPSPAIHEYLMAWPDGWSDTAPLETGKFQSWQQRHYGHLLMLIERIQEA